MIDILFKDLLISVTNFFRDPEARDALAKPLHPLVSARPENCILRAWVPGCSTSAADEARS